MRFLAALAAALLLAVLLAEQPSYAGIITAQGDVSALNDISAIRNQIGFADFENIPTIPTFFFSSVGPEIEPDPSGVYAHLGLQIQGGAFAGVLPGIVSTGDAVATRISNNNDYGDHFRGPIAGGGTHYNNVGVLGFVATFSVPVFQAGATFSSNGQQYITAWDSAGALIGQVRWTPIRTDDAAFVGLDSGGVRIAMLSFGNDDVFAGQPYNVTGDTTLFDSVVWGARADVPEPGSLALVLAGVAAALAAIARNWALRKTNPF